MVTTVGSSEPDFAPGVSDHTTDDFLSAAAAAVNGPEMLPAADADLPPSWFDGDDDNVADLAGTKMRWLPSAPLVSAVEARGGLSACGIIEGVDDSLIRAYYRAINRGLIGLYHADELAVRCLLYHPAQLWGDLWFDGGLPPATSREPEQAQAS